MDTHRDIPRRRFLQLGGAAAAAGLAKGCVTEEQTPPAPPVAQETPSEAAPVPAADAVAVGVIGCGARGMHLLDELRGLPEARVAVVCDVYAPREERAQAQSGAVTLRDWRELTARPDIDAVVVATPDHWHAPMAVAAMRAGKDVYCEAPMALTLEAAFAMAETARQTGRVLQIGAQAVSAGPWRAARKLVAKGALGPVAWAQYAAGRPQDHALPTRPAKASELDWKAWLGPAEARPFDAERFHNWRDYWDYSGGAGLGGFYDGFAALLMATGPAFPARVSAAGGVADKARETPDMFLTTAEYPGFDIVLTTSAANGRSLPPVIRGRDATLYVERRRLRAVQEAAGRGHFESRFGGKSPAAIEAPAGGSHLGDWLACVKTRETPACGPELGLAAMTAAAMGVQAYRRAETLAWDPETQRVIESPPRVLPMASLT